MDEAIRAHLKALEDAVQATAVPDDRKQTALWCLRQLPPLYALSYETGESRHDDGCGLPLAWLWPAACR